MVSQYPHKLLLRQHGGHSQKPNGDWIELPFEFIEFSDCRLEPNGAGSKITLTDGKAYQFSSTVYMPPRAWLREGEVIRIYDGEQIIAEGQIARFHRGQLNHKLWL